MRLKDKVAIITGGGRGIGKAIAIGFAREGAKIIVTARTREEIESVAGEINNSGGKCVSICCDISDEKQVKDMIEKSLLEFGRNVKGSDIFPDYVVLYTRKSRDSN